MKWYEPAFGIPLGGDDPRRMKEEDSVGGSFFPGPSHTPPPLPPQPHSLTPSTRLDPFKPQPTEEEEEGDVGYLSKNSSLLFLRSKLSLKKYQHNLQPSSTSQTQLQVCWRTTLVEEDALLYRFHGYWKDHVKEAKLVWDLKESYARWLKG